VACSLGGLVFFQLGADRAELLLSLHDALPICSDDARTWSIVLDERATFQDGSPVNAEAVRWNFNRMLSRNKGNAWMFAAVMDQEDRKSTRLNSSHVKISYAVLCFVERQELLRS